MKQVFIIITLLLAGCGSTVPSVKQFPNAPHELLEKCPQLKTLDVNDPSIITMSRTIVENYTMYHQCSNKIDAWIEWYSTQKNINNANCLKVNNQCK